MKKVILLFTMLLSANVFASRLFYCPESIVCAQAGNISSCQAVGGDTAFWGNMRSSGSVEPATYKFSSAVGLYQNTYAKPDNTNTFCMYVYVGKNITKYIDIYPNKKNNGEFDNLQVHFDSSNTQWIVNGVYAECNGFSNSCPYDLFLGK